MAIPHGCGNVAMPQYFLHGEKIDSGHNESRGQGMAQGVPTGSGDACFSQGRGEVRIHKGLRISRLQRIAGTWEDPRTR